MPVRFSIDSFKEWDVLCMRRAPCVRRSCAAPRQSCAADYLGIAQLDVCWPPLLSRLCPPAPVAVGGFTGTILGKWMIETRGLLRAGQNALLGTVRAGIATNCTRRQAPAIWWVVSTLPPPPAAPMSTNPTWCLAPAGGSAGSGNRHLLWLPLRPPGAGRDWPAGRRRTACHHRRHPAARGGLCGARGSLALRGVEL